MWRPLHLRHQTFETFSPGVHLHHGGQREQTPARNAHRRTRVETGELAPKRAIASRIDCLSVFNERGRRAHMLAREIPWPVGCTNGLHAARAGRKALHVKSTLFLTLAALVAFSCAACSAPRDRQVTGTTEQATESCSAEWGQCGGNGWTGPTCCVSGTACVLFHCVVADEIASLSSHSTRAAGAARGAPQHGWRATATYP